MPLHKNIFKITILLLLHPAIKKKIIKYNNIYSMAAGELSQGTEACNLNV
jgi:hypothetical protein